MKRQYIELYNRIDKILWEDWDPIGVNDNENIRDEYSSYVPYIVKLKTDGADIVKIANHLYQLETGSLGMNGSMERCREIAQKIIELQKPKTAM